MKDILQTVIYKIVHRAHLSYCNAFLLFVLMFLVMNVIKTYIIYDLTWQFAIYIRVAYIFCVSVIIESINHSS